MKVYVSVSKHILVKPEEMLELDGTEHEILKKKSEPAVSILNFEHVIAVWVSDAIHAKLSRKLES